jgi:RNA-directed DNA polymerase
METNFPNNPFARYADDGVVHCRSEAQARYLKDCLERRFRECKLELHPEKTQVVCCHVGKQQNTQVAKKFDFLGYCFRARLVRSRYGKMFVSFTPAISPRSAKKIRQQARRWQLHLRTSQSLDDIVRAINPAIRGWVNYYGAYQRSTLLPALFAHWSLGAPFPAE